MEKLYLRIADINDAELLFDWVNEESVRQNSFNTGKIPWESHLDWFTKALDNKDIRIWVMVLDDVPVGQVRFTFVDNHWLISYSIATAYRGQGYGKTILRLAENELINTGHIGEVLYAEVKRDNVVSQIIFHDLGYRKCKSNHDNAYGYEKAIVQIKCVVDTF